jgi:DNA-binding HxlR family transcriptional regulator
LLGADGGLTLSEVAAAIPGADRSPLSKSTRKLVEWGLVLRDVGGRSKNYGLTDGARQLLSDIDDPSIDRGTEYRAAATTLGELLATRWYLPPLAPSTIALEAAIDAVRAVPSSPLGAVTLQVPITSPRALLDALRTAPDGLTLTELSRAVPGTVKWRDRGLRTRLQALVNWQLIREVHSERNDGRPRRAYQLTGQAKRLLRQLDTPRPGDGTDLEELRRLLLEPSHLQPAAGQTTRLAAAIESVRATRYGPLSTVAGSVRGILGLIGAGGGLTGPDLVEMVPDIRLSSMRRRLGTLVRWDLVRIGADTQTGRTDWSGRLYTLPDHTRRLLADLDDPQTVESIAYRRAIEQLGLLFDRRLGLMPHSSVTAEAEAAINAVRAAPGNPLVAAGSARPANSLRDTLETVAAAPGGITAAELVGRTPGLGRSAMHLRLKAFVALGLVRAQPGRGGAPDRGFRYDMPGRTRRILADLDRTSALGTDQRVAVVGLAELLDGSPSLTPTSGGSQRLETAMRAVLPFYPVSSAGPPAIGGLTGDQLGDAVASGPASTGGWLADPARGTGGPHAPPGPDET